MNERQIFEATLDIADLARREAFLSHACGADTALRTRVDALLTAHAAASQFLETPAVQQLHTSPDSSGEDTMQLPPSHLPAEGDSDDAIPNGPDISFLQPSKKAGSIGTLGHYEILNVLGQGAFGIVFRAFDEKLHRHVAIKTMSVQMAATSPPRKRFLREARAAAAIRHENVVQVYSVEEQPLPYLVMEFIDGETLQQKQRDHGPLELPELLHVGRQIAAGLAAAHAQSLIHRDVKPGNILLEKGAEQKVKITDFGLARAADDASLTRSGMISGTPLYMAPEQALGQTLDHRSDLFSLGSVLYELATGRPPFRAPNTVAVLRRVVDDTPRPIQEIIPETPDWLVTVVDKLLEKKPDDRYQSAKEVADLLARCQSELQLTGQVTCVPVGNPASVRREPDGSPTLSAEQPSGSRRTLASAPAARGILGQAWHEWWSEIDRWIALSIQTLLILVHLGCMICLLSMGASSGHDAEGHATFEYRLGVPSPWFRFLVYPEPLKPFQTMLNLFSSSMLIGLVGCLAYYVNWRIEKVRNPHMSKWDRPGIILGFWGLAALIAVSLGLWQGYAALDKPRVAVESGDPASGAASAPRVPATPANSGGSRPPLAQSWHGWPAEAPAPAIAPFDAEQAQQHQAAWAKYLGVPVEYTNSLGMKFRLIPPGEFMMGTAAGDPKTKMSNVVDDENPRSVPQHPVHSTGAYFAGIHEVTIEQFRKYIAATKATTDAESSGLGAWQWDRAQGKSIRKPELVWRTPGFATGERVPVTCVTAQDATRFCEWLSKEEGRTYRLPTEAEWEYMCRAGTTTPFAYGLQLIRAQAVFSADAPETVGTHPANAFGLCDMHGNASEWCADGPRTYAVAKISDPHGPLGNRRVMRGGDFDSHLDLQVLLQSLGRASRALDYSSWGTGFRVVLVDDLPRSGAAEAVTEAPLPATFKNSIGMEFVIVPKGKSWLGGGKDKLGDKEVEIPADFYLGKYHVTQEEWEKVMEDNPSYFSRKGAGQDEVKDVSDEDLKRFPVDYVSWDACQIFVARLNKREKDTGWVYRLPKEVEWEYACRGGPMSDKLDSAFDFYFAQPTNAAGMRENLNTGTVENPVMLGRTCKVGMYEPNVLGLHDMYGNLAVWCGDAAKTYDGFDGYALRGGSWNSPAEYCRAACRLTRLPSNQSQSTGLRLIRVPSGVPSPEAKTPSPAIAPFNAEQAQHHQEAWAQSLGVPVEHTNSLGMQFRLIPPGEFMMGSTAAEIEAVLKEAFDAEGLEKINSEAPQHKVVLTQPIYLGVHEVTQAEYEKIMQKNPSKFAATGDGRDAVAGLDTGRHPVENVCWNDTVEFCAKLSEQEKLKACYVRSGQAFLSQTGNGYRLPTEAEWEFAGRAGTTTRFSTGDQARDLAQASWFKANSGGRTHDVGGLTDNAFGLHDIHGNVHEWVQDWWESNYYREFEDQPAMNPSGPVSGFRRALRTGGWRSDPSSCRTTLRDAHDPASIHDDIGFRVSLSVDAVRQALKLTGPALPQPVSTTPPAPASDLIDYAAERQVAEWAIELKAQLAIESEGQLINVTEVAQLPSGPFHVHSLVIPAGTALKPSDLQMIGKLRSLKLLSLRETSGVDAAPESLSQLTTLEYLDLLGSGITDAGMPQLSGMKNLAHLELTFTAVGNAGMAAVSQLTHLKYLGLGESRVGDDGLAQLKTLDQVEILSVGATVTDQGLGQLANLPKLTEVAGLKSHHLTEVGIGHLQQLPNVTHLNVVQATDEDLLRLKPLAHLTALFFNLHQFSPSGLEALSEFPKLDYLILGDHPNFDDSYWPPLIKLSTLRKLYLQEVRVTAEGIAKFREQRPEVWLDVNGTVYPATKELDAPSE